MAEKIYLKNINLGGIIYGLGFTSDDFYAELGISKERFVELLSRDMYCPMLDKAPSEETITYIDADGSVNHFQYGQTCRYQDEEGVWQIYILKGLDNGNALWYQLPTKLSQLEDDLGLATTEELTNTVNSLSVGGENLLVNSGFTGDYTFEYLESDDTLNEKKEVFSRPLKYWEGTASVSDDQESISGKSVDVTDISQHVELVEGLRYTVSFKAKGSSLTIYCGDFSQTFSLTSGYEKFVASFIHAGLNEFRMSGSAQVCDLKLERGNFATDWEPSVNDNDKTMAEFQSVKHLTDGIKEVSSESIRGMVLTSYINLGNFKDGILEEVHAGVNGVFNDSDDIAFWGGGTLEKAIETFSLFKENPNYIPTAEEWSNLCKFIVTHGGDVILRGYIHALGGEATLSKVQSDTYMVSGQSGITEDISINAKDGVHQLVFKSGLLVSSTFTSN